MKKNLIICLSILSFSGEIFAQNTFLISFKDKPSISNYEPSELLTQDALYRRSKENVRLDDFDTPINPFYIQELKSNGIKIQGKSKWLNTVLVESDLSKEEITQISSNIKHVRFIENNDSDILMKSSQSKFSNQAIDYGDFQWYADKYEVPYIHDQGYQGNNVKVAIIDVGFIEMDNLGFFADVFSQSRIKDTWNFWTDSTDVYVDHGHGTYVSGFILGNSPGSYVGLAPQADVYLYLTDKIDTETPQDEFKLVQALERADSLGVEIVNLSLAYQYFDNSMDDYSDADKDGQTAISTLGVNIAADKGMLIMSGVGNEAVRACAPSDANGILAVGGTFSDLTYDNISNIGPSYDGRQKPEVSGFTRSIKAINEQTDDVQTVNYGGTSGATPQITGLAICLKQKHPNATKDELRLAIMNSAHLASSPNDQIGYGVPNIRKADSLLQEYLNIEDFVTIDQVSVFPNPSVGFVQIKHLNERIKNIQVYNLSGRLLTKIKGNSDETYNFASFPHQTLLLSIELESGLSVHSKLVID